MKYLIFILFLSCVHGCRRNGRRCGFRGANACCSGRCNNNFCVENNICGAITSPCKQSSDCCSGICQYGQCLSSIPASGADVSIPALCFEAPPICASAPPHCAQAPSQCALCAGCQLGTCPGFWCITRCRRFQGCEDFIDCAPFAECAPLLANIPTECLSVPTFCQSVPPQCVNTPPQCQNCTNCLSGSCPSYCISTCAPYQSCLPYAECLPFAECAQYLPTSLGSASPGVNTYTPPGGYTPSYVEDDFGYDEIEFSPPPTNLGNIPAKCLNAPPKCQNVPNKCLDAPRECTQCSSCLEDIASCPSFCAATCSAFLDCIDYLECLPYEDLCRQFLEGVPGGGLAGSQGANYDSRYDGSSQVNNNYSQVNNNYSNSQISYTSGGGGDYYASGGLRGV
eukprot:GHVL01044601.1.p1 GENE.GHVL01044601.1~~GHVL01044601.1.p1  ORF type:complete len:396 (+),score=80.08 GHVL01044601.1:415-1602(+)